MRRTDGVGVPVPSSQSLILVDRVSSRARMHNLLHHKGISAYHIWYNQRQDAGGSEIVLAVPRQRRRRSGQGSVLTKLRVRDLELLLAIHEHKSITSAALQLGLTQPAASRALREMEQLLRVHLFERDRIKGMSLTAAGELVLTRARALLADYRSMTMELDAYRAGTGGHLRLGVIQFVPGTPDRESDHRVDRARSTGCPSRSPKDPPRSCSTTCACRRSMP